MKSANGFAKQQRLFFAFNFKIAILMVLLLNIGFNDIVSHVAAATAKIASGSKVTTPILTAKRLKAVQQLMRTFTL